MKTGALKTLSFRLNRYRVEKMRRKIAKESAKCEQVKKTMEEERPVNQYKRTLSQEGCLTKSES